MDGLENLSDGNAKLKDGILFFCIGLLVGIFASYFILRSDCPGKIKDPKTHKAKIQSIKKLYKKKN